MFCPKCGNQVPDGAPFCTACGNALTAQQAAPVVQQAAPVVQQAAPVVQQPQKYQPMSEKTAQTLGLASMIVGIASLALALLIPIIGWAGGSNVAGVCGGAGLALGIVAFLVSRAHGFENKNARLGIWLSAAGICAGVLIETIAGWIAVEKASNAYGTALDMYNNLF